MVVRRERIRCGGAETSSRRVKTRTIDEALAPHLILGLESPRKRLLHHLFDNFDFVFRLLDAPFGGSLDEEIEPPLPGRRLLPRRVKLSLVVIAVPVNSAICASNLCVTFQRACCGKSLISSSDSKYASIFAARAAPAACLALSAAAKAAARPRRWRRQRQRARRRVRYRQRRRRAAAAASVVGAAGAAMDAAAVGVAFGFAAAAAAATRGG